MKDAKTISLMAVLTIILVFIGVFSLWQKYYSWAGILGFGEQEANKIAFWKMVPELVGFSGEKTYLVLFQNDAELRPSGGYLGNFAIVKVKNGRPVSMGIHDTNIFDGFSTVQTEPPQAIKDYLGQTNWQMRDSNWSPDFPTAAKQVEYFYRLQGGEEDFDGIIAVNAAVLPSLMEFTGPIYLEEFDKEFKAENVLYELQYEVEKGYWQRGIEMGDRKSAFKALVMEMANELNKKAIWKSQDLKDLALQELDEKNIQLYLEDKEKQTVISAMNWSGEVEQEYDGNYLMLVEANLGALKSNTFVERSVEYSVDFSKQRPEVYLRIKYTHSNAEKSWLNEDYRCYLRVYLPAGSWLVRYAGMESEVKFMDELNKTVFGSWIVVPAGQSKTVEYKFLLKADTREQASQKILVQKQSGVKEMSFSYTAKDVQGMKTKVEKIIRSDWEGIITEK